MAYIYKITNLLNGKFYVGKSVRDNAFSMKNYYGSGVVIKQAIRKYGKENFKKEILEEVKNIDILSERERWWIASLDAQNPSIGYNRSPGGDGGCTPEAAKKGAITRRLNGYIHHSEETKRKLSEAHRGKKFSEEHKNNLKLRHHLRMTHVILKDDFTYQKIDGGLENFCKEIGISVVRLRRASEVFDFRHHYVVLDQVNCEKSFNHRYAGSSARELVFKSPITNEVISPVQWRMYRQYHKEECSKYEYFPWTDEMLEKKKKFFEEINLLKEKTKNNLSLESDRGYLCGFLMGKRQTT